MLPVTYQVSVPWSEVYGRAPVSDESLADCDHGDPWPIWNSEARLLEVWKSDTYPGQPLARLDVELRGGNPFVIEFTDASTGDVVEEIPALYPGRTPEQLIKGLRGWGFHDIVLVVSTAGEQTARRPPWAKGEEWMGSLVSHQGAVYTMSYEIADDFSASAIKLWRTHDGHHWEQIGLPTLGTGALERADLVQGQGQLLMKVQDMADGGSLWVSTDGVQWDRVATPVVPTHELIWTDFGWILYDAFGPDAFSVDARSWQSLEMPPVDEASIQYENGRLFLGPVGAGDSYTMWVGVPADRTGGPPAGNATECRPKCWRPGRG
jgi:hypothetical protein